MGHQKTVEQAWLTVQAFLHWSGMASLVYEESFVQRVDIITELKIWNGKWKESASFKMKPCLQKWLREEQMCQTAEEMDKKVS